VEETVIFGRGQLVGGAEMVPLQGGGIHIWSCTMHRVFGVHIAGRLDMGGQRTVGQPERVARCVPNAAFSFTLYRVSFIKCPYVFLDGLDLSVLHT